MAEEVRKFCLPEPVPSRPVAGPLKQAFADWIDRRTAQGVETYGQLAIYVIGRPTG